MKLYSSEHKFSYHWDHVAAAHWQKYPNEHSTQVLSVDILSRDYDKSSGILKTERLITCEQPIPSFFRRIFGMELEKLYFRETSIVDSKSKILQAKSTNLTGSDLMELEEDITYSVDSKHGDTTKLRQVASVNISCSRSYKMITNQVEDFCVHRFKTNAEKGRKGLEEAIRKIFPESTQASHHFM